MKYAGREMVKISTSCGVDVAHRRNFRGCSCMRDMALQDLQYYATVDQSSNSRRSARVQAPNNHSGTATRKLPYDEEILPPSTHITNNS